MTDIFNEMRKETGRIMNLIKNKEEQDLNEKIKIEQDLTICKGCIGKGLGKVFNKFDDSENKVKALQEKLDIAVKALDISATYLTCMDDLSELNDGKCNEQMALETINEALAKIKEIK